MMYNSHVPSLRGSPGPRYLSWIRRRTSIQMQLPYHPLSSQQSSELRGKACHVTHFESNIIRRWQAADKELLIGALANLTEYEADFPRLLRTGGCTS